MGNLINNIEQEEGEFKRWDLTIVKQPFRAVGSKDTFDQDININI